MKWNFSFGLWLLLLLLTFTETHSLKLSKEEEEEEFKKESIELKDWSSDLEDFAEPSGERVEQSSVNSANIGVGAAELSAAPAAPEDPDVEDEAAVLPSEARVEESSANSADYGAVASSVAPPAPEDADAEADAPSESAASTAPTAATAPAALTAPTAPNAPYTPTGPTVPNAPTAPNPATAPSPAMAPNPVTAPNPATTAPNTPGGNKTEGVEDSNCSDVYPNCFEVASAVTCSFLKGVCDKACGFCHRCLDTLEVCPDWVGKGFCDRIAPHVCAKSCDKCEEVASTAGKLELGKFEENPDPSKSNGAETECKDFDPFCKVWSSLGLCTVFANKMCKRSCRVCGDNDSREKSGTDSGTGAYSEKSHHLCIDKWIDCQQIANEQNCLVLKDKCAKTCNMCGENTTKSAINAAANANGTNATGAQRKENVLTKHITITPLPNGQNTTATESSTQKDQNI